VRFSGFICVTTKYELHILIQGYDMAMQKSWHCWVKEAKLARNEEIHTLLFNARTASLCSHNSGGAVNRTQRIGTEYLEANAMYLLRTSESAFVLSENWKIVRTVSVDM